MYESIKKNRPDEDEVKNSQIEIIEFNGISAIKETVEWDTTLVLKKYTIYLTFIHKENTYTFSFNGNNLNSVESNFEFVKSNLKLK